MSTRPLTENRLGTSVGRRAKSERSEWVLTDALSVEVSYIMLVSGSRLSFPNIHVSEMFLCCLVAKRRE